jgi:hypothetical protein
MKVCFKNDKKPIYIEIFIHNSKYIKVFLILYTKCARTFVYVLQCAANQKRSRTTGLWRCMCSSLTLIPIEATSACLFTSEHGTYLNRSYCSHEFQCFVCVMLYCIWVTVHCNNIRVELSVCCGGISFYVVLALCCML